MERLKSEHFLNSYQSWPTVHGLSGPWFSKWGNAEGLAYHARDSFRQGGKVWQVSNSSTPFPVELILALLKDFQPFHLQNELEHVSNSEQLWRWVRPPKDHVFIYKKGPTLSSSNPVFLLWDSGLFKVPIWIFELEIWLMARILIGCGLNDSTSLESHETHVYYIMHLVISRRPNTQDFQWFLSNKLTKLLSC